MTSMNASRLIITVAILSRQVQQNATVRPLATHCQPKPILHQRALARLPLLGQYDIRK